MTFSGENTHFMGIMIGNIGGCDVSYIKSSVVIALVCWYGTFLTLTLNVNNSVTFQLRMFPKVANERYCNIFFI